MKTLHRLSLRFRNFLFFAFLALAVIMATFGALYLGYRRADEFGTASAFTFAGVVALFSQLAIITGIWFLFDENIARPIERLAANLRAKVHAKAGGIDKHDGRYLGDLVEATESVTRQLSTSTMDQASAVAHETARLNADKARLTALLSEIPVAMVLVNPNHQIVLYDSQAAGILSQVSPPRLNASIFEYFQKGPFMEAYEKMLETGKEQGFSDRSAHFQFHFDVRIKPLDSGDGYMLVIDDTHADFAPDAARPVVFDFELMQSEATGDLWTANLNDLTFVVFDTETTGLQPHKDEIVQIGAVRVMKSKIVPGEQIDMLVDPERPIPAASTKVHGISDAMVTGAPTVIPAIKKLYSFASGAVLVAHNAPFDMAFLHNHEKEAGLDWNHPILDTVLLSAVLFGRTEVHTLDALCDRLDVVIPPELRHTALGDAHATAEVLCKMLAMLQSRGVATLAEAVAEAKTHSRLLKDLN
ncbi:DNA polymerase-3 subunit epsilon [Aliiroseovarius crassostreae]|uniref:DNA-directed DNA polymerase n=1 Tax=Aliiroseovarius crassostreae TaxID=154981 RepID=A0A0P7HZ19_9RHOB|nr:exonuclease domain-containing protein [Aliiroseovarius crassostreae]KPN61822.1 3'-5' exonuclease [Aliiroseovarius crassostreae]SFU47485.1 DNA polymerase-3 subunit epsilon [Aliiroseovarius crassostreae]